MRVIAKDAIEMSSVFLDLPFSLAKMQDEEGNARTPRQYCEANSIPIELNETKTRAIIWIEISFLDGDYQGIAETLNSEALKTIFDGQMPRLQKDITSTSNLDFRIMSYSEHIEFRKVNKNWKISSENDE